MKKIKEIKNYTSNVSGALTFKPFTFKDLSLMKAHLHSCNSKTPPEGIIVTGSNYKIKEIDVKNIKKDKENNNDETK